MKRCEEQRARFYASFDRNEGKILDDRFALPDDAPLTEDEIKAIDAYWGKYSFAYPKIDYKSFQTYKNRYGKLDVRHCPGNVEYNFFFKRFEKTPWAIPFQNKAMLPILYSNVYQPKTLVRRMNNILYNGDYQPITIAQAVEIILERESDLAYIFVAEQVRQFDRHTNLIEPEEVTPLLGCDLQQSSRIVNTPRKRWTRLRINPYYPARTQILDSFFNLLGLVNDNRFAIKLRYRHQIDQFFGNMVYKLLSVFH